VSDEDLTQYLEASGLLTVSSAHDAGGIEKALRALVAAARPLSPVSRALLIEAAARHLSTVGIKRATRIVDAAFAAVPEPSPSSTLFPVVEPAHEPVNGAELIVDIIDWCEQFLSLPRWGAIKLAFWIVFTHVWDAFDSSPLLAITSATAESGKTRVIDFVGYLAVKPWRTTAATTASVFRQIDAEQPTVLFDEFDNVDLATRKELIAVLNVGHSRDGAFVSRCVGDNYEPTLFNVYSPKLVAGIGQFLPETTWSRCIIIEMQPKPNDVSIRRLIRREVEPTFRELRSRIARWAIDNVSALRDSTPSIPDGIGDRLADSYGPLFAIADTMGGVWGGKVRQAAQESIDGNFSEVGKERQLLIHVREVFALLGFDRLPTIDLLAALNGNAEWPWKYRGKDGLTAYDFSRLLKPFRVGRPKSLYIKGQPYAHGKEYAKGYYLKQFQPAFASYLRNVPIGGGDDVSSDDTQSFEQPHDITDITVISPPHPDVHDVGDE